MNGIDINFDEHVDFVVHYDLSRELFYIVLNTETLQGIITGLEINELKQLNEQITETLVRHKDK